jgi:membrane-associated protease RseP (regulator of RpoE activity)
VGLGITLNVEADPLSQTITGVPYWIFRFRRETKTIQSAGKRVFAIPIRITGTVTIETTSPTTLYTLTTDCGYSITGSVTIKLPSNSLLDILMILHDLP